MIQGFCATDPIYTLLITNYGDPVALVHLPKTSAALLVPTVAVRFIGKHSSLPHLDTYLNTFSPNLLLVPIMEPHFIEARPMYLDRVEHSLSCARSWDIGTCHRHDIVC